MSEQNVEKVWRCPYCQWEQRAHLVYGWQQHDERAVEVHKATLCPFRNTSEEPSASEQVLTAGDLTDDHIGMVVLDVPGISGWERHLLLRNIEWRKNGLWLHFRWNDDPSPSNTHRGEYAVGQRVPTATPVRVLSSLSPAPQEPCDHPTWYALTNPALRGWRRCTATCGQRFMPSIPSETPTP